jgi:hypothetical protein
MRPLVCSFLVAWFSGSCSGLADPWKSPGGPAPSSAAVVVELFTSEGCSSCPPADEVLSDLVGRQPVENVTVIGLGEHVDYWDRLGWRDPFSSAMFTARQSDYEAHVFRSGTTYTPQLVVDGRYQAVGSDRAAVSRAIRDAARLAKATVDVRTAIRSATELRAQIQVNVPSELSTDHVLDIFTAVVEHDLATNVQRGENRGRLLRHSAVTRTLTLVGAIDRTERTFSKTVAVNIDKTWRKPNLQLVALVQDQATRHIIGAAFDTLNDRLESWQ